MLWKKEYSELEKGEMGTAQRHGGSWNFSDLRLCRLTLGADDTKPEGAAWKLNHRTELVCDVLKPMAQPP